MQVCRLERGAVCQLPICNSTWLSLSTGHLSPEEAQAFEDHYLTCAACAAALEETEQYVVAMKRAAKRLRGGTVAAGAG